LPQWQAGSQVINGQCQACHAGPLHHGQPNAGELSACAECHRDHRGQDASLVRVDDSTCTSCHSNLAEHRSATAKPLARPVTGSVSRFDGNAAHHPEFRALEKDPGRLEFNHALHQAKGFTLQKGGKDFTFAQVAEAERTRFGWSPAQGLDSAVPPLGCGSCHKLDSREYVETGARTATSGAILPARAARAYLLPVTYENHCRACHPLEFDAKSSGKKVRHGLSPREVLDDLRQFYSAQAVEADPKLLGRFIPPRPKPGSPPESPFVQARQAVDDKVLTAARILFGSSVDDETLRREELPAGRRGCVECHHLSGATGPLVRSDAISKIDIVPVKVPTVWFERAAFDHSAHRAVDCIACHSAAQRSKRSSDVLLPGITNCLQCHGPSSDGGGQARGGAGNSCTECHRYHNGDHPLEGIGARARGVDARQTIEQFLRGTRKQPSP